MAVGDMEHGTSAEWWRLVPESVVGAGKVLIVPLGSQFMLLMLVVR